MAINAKGFLEKASKASGSMVNKVAKASGSLATKVSGRETKREEETQIQTPIPKTQELDIKVTETKVERKPVPKNDTVDNIKAIERSDTALTMVEEAPTVISEDKMREAIMEPKSTPVNERIGEIKGISRIDSNATMVNSSPREITEEPIVESQVGTRSEMTNEDMGDIKVISRSGSDATMIDSLPRDLTNDNIAVIRPEPDTETKGDDVGDIKAISRSDSASTIDTLPTDKVDEKVIEATAEHQKEWDLNLPEDEKSMKSVAVTSTAEEEKGTQPPEEENSPYEEVRAAVPNWDEQLPANTIRAWVIGLTLTIFGSGVNTLFSIRNPSIGLGSIVAQLIAFAAGKAWYRIMPDRQFKTFGFTWNLNPGPFNYKEHSVILVMANVSFGTAYATDIILAQEMFYKQKFGLAFQLLLVITSQSLGYGIAGLLRKFLVYPAAMIWPSNLVQVTLMHAMHEKNVDPDPTILGGMMSRWKWWGIIFACSFFYYFIPGFLMQFLSIFAFMTWIYPNRPVINQLFGGTTGLSLIPITFDWTQVIGFTGNPMIPPWHAIGNTLIGVLTFYIFGGMALHYGGAWYAKYLPISDSGIYDNMGKNYNVTRVANTAELTLNEAAYKEYSPLFLSTTFAISYGLSFATIASLVVYTWIHYRHQIMAQFKKAHVEEQDVHMKMMLKYPETPNSWYAGVFVLMIALSFVVVLKWPTEFAWWAFLIAIAFSTIMTLPIGIIEAITNQQIGLNVITEFIMGYMQPGKPLALMMFKTYGYITASQALGFVGDLKFGHYMKIPPRTMFTAQVVATILSCFIQVFVLNFSMSNIKDVCQITQKQHFTCPGAKVFFSASVIWGLLGPQRIFSPGQVYAALLIGFPLGALLPIVLYYATKRWPRSNVRFAMAPVILGGGGSIPPASPLNYLTWGVVGFIFQKVIRERNFRWWSRLNYLTASGLDTGLAICTLFIFFAFTLNNIDGPKWWYVFSLIS
jgi:OPT family small oligopeptide transporter